VSRALGIGPTTGGLLVLSIGVILSATLAPGAISEPWTGTTACDLSRVGLAPWREYLQFASPIVNVLLFVPLGVLVGLLPRTRRTAAVVVAAIALPFAIEAIQLVVTPLGRACQSADVADNLVGLAVGVVAGVVARRGLRSGAGRATGTGA
jgi:hypothetical protein